MAPGGGKGPKTVRRHLVVTLRAGWTFESARRVFRSAEGQTFDPKPALPARTRIEYRTPTLADRPQAELSPAERDLARYLQLILPTKVEAEAYLDNVREWPAVARAELSPVINLP